jgi:hypothetical protein
MMDADDREYLEQKFNSLEAKMDACVSDLESRVRVTEIAINTMDTQLSTIKWVGGIIWIATTAVVGTILQWVRR